MRTINPLPKKISEVLQACPDRDLEAHLRAIKKAFPNVKLLGLSVATEEEFKIVLKTAKKQKRKKSEPVQTSLF
jgi:hypothetical protein